MVADEYYASWGEWSYNEVSTIVFDLNVTAIGINNNIYVDINWKSLNEIKSMNKTLCWAHCKDAFSLKPCIAFWLCKALFIASARGTPVEIYTNKTSEIIFNPDLEEKNCWIFSSIF